MRVFLAEGWTQMNETTRRYRGFISYSQKDKTFAKRLHKALEAYTLPGGKKLGRFFRDDDELGGAASLGEALQSAIHDSEDLIVIASPHSAQSKWVNEEVIHFKKLADPDKQVFAVVIDGAPNAHEAALECFVPALRSRVSPTGDLTGEPDEPLAPDARKEPFKRLVTKLAAGLEGVPFDDLWQRQKRRARQRALTSTLIIAALAAPLIWWGATTVSKLESSTTQLESLDVDTQRSNFLDGYYVNIVDAQWAQETPQEYLLSREDYDGAIQILLETDLNDDGYQDYYIRLEHIEFCGSGGCLHDIVLNDGGVYRSLRESNGGDLQVLTTRQNGLRDLGLGFGGLDDGASVYSMLRYNGETYGPAAYAVCGGVVSYCGLSSVFSDTPYGDTMDMVFYPPADPDMTADGAIYRGVQGAMDANASERIQSSFDYIAGVDESGEYALVHIWKGTYGVMRIAK